MILCEFCLQLIVSPYTAICAETLMLKGRELADAELA